MEESSQPYRGPEPTVKIPLEVGHTTLRLTTRDDQGVFGIPTTVNITVDPPEVPLLGNVDGDDNVDLDDVDDFVKAFRREVGLSDLDFLAVLDIDQDN
ncbi:hypothetical protein BVX98_03010, partial [bacterium F11]